MLVETCKLRNWRRNFQLRKARSQFRYSWKREKAEILRGGGKGLKAFKLMEPQIDEESSVSSRTVSQMEYFVVIRRFHPLYVIFQTRIARPKRLPCDPIASENANFNDSSVSSLFLCKVSFRETEKKRTKRRKKKDLVNAKRTRTDRRSTEKEK